MPFALLFPGESKTAPDTRLVQLEPVPKASPKSKKPKKSGNDERGCKYCTLNKVPGIKKIMGTIKGRDILVFAQSPGPDENEEGTELVGRAGQWWWDELGRVGIRRKHCDVQNAVRCYPADYTAGTYEVYLKMRNPTPHEIKCCSLHTEEKFKEVKAKQILVLGAVAAKQLLKTRSLPQTKVFWSDELNAKVYLLDHPAFFIRGYASAERLKAFRETLDLVAADRKKTGKTLSDRFAYVKKQKYHLVLNKEQAIEARNELRKYAKRRVATDIEDDVWGENGERRILAVGFCVKPGESWVFVLKHDEVSQKDGNAVRDVAISILQDERFRFSYHYGCSDVNKWRKYEGIEPVNFDHDTNLSEYLRFSDRTSYSLDSICEARFPKFSGYKNIVAEEMLKGVDVPNSIVGASLEAKSKYIESKKLFSIRKLSLDTLRLYNGADCDLTKRIEISNKDHVPQALMNLYIDLNFLLAEMEPNGPWFDYRQHKKLNTIYPYKIKRLLRRIRKVAKNKKFNPGAPQQVYDFIYDELQLEPPRIKKKGKIEKPNTRKGTLLMMKSQHKFPGLILEYRPLTKMESMLESYKRSADMHEGRVRTKWWSTRARTGRLASGAGRSKEVGLINLQNIKKDAQIRNMLVADTRWQSLYLAACLKLKSFAALGEYWKKYTAWDLLPRPVKKETPKPVMDPSAEHELGKFGSWMVRWVEANVPDLKAFLAFDYGQVEVRVMAEMSGDENLKRDCIESDIHSRVGSTMTGWDIERIRKDEQTRTLTKNVHFGIMFGLAAEGLYHFVVAMSPPDMAGRITMEEVQEAFDNYFKRYKKVRRFHEKQRAFAKIHKCVFTLFGMRQALRITEGDDGGEQFDFDDEQEKIRTSYWGNQCINGPVQGTAHQLLICALVNLLRKREKYQMLGIPPMEVHDAGYFYTNVLEILKAYKVGKYLLEQESLKTAKKDFGIKFDVPIVTEAKAGLQLGSMVEIEKVKSTGEFLANWFYEARKQVIVLNRELKAVTA